MASLDVVAIGFLILLGHPVKSTFLFDKSDLYLLDIDSGIHVNAEGHHQPNKYESCHFGPSTRPKNRFQYSMAHPGNHTVNTRETIQNSYIITSFRV